MQGIVKIGPVELTEKEAERLYGEHKYIVTYSKVFQLFHGGKSYPHVYGQVIYEKPTKDGVGLARRGRFYALTGAAVNSVLGFSLVNE